MSTFNQTNQTVGNQTNINNQINAPVRNEHLDFIKELRILKNEVLSAGEKEISSSSIIEDIEGAIVEATNDSPNGNAIVEHLSRARDFIKGLAKFTAITAGIVKAIELARKLF